MKTEVSRTIEVQGLPDDRADITWGAEYAVACDHAALETYHRKAAQEAMRCF